MSWAKEEFKGIDLGDKRLDKRAVLEGEPLGEARFTLPSRPGRKARTVRQQVWARRVKLGDGQVEATCIVAREIGAPGDVEAIEWRLLTNRETAGFEAATEMIDWYRARWEIEMFFLEA